MYKSLVLGIGRREQIEIPRPVRDSIGVIIYPVDGFSKQKHKYELVLPENKDEPYFFLLFCKRGSEQRKRLPLKHSLLFRITNTPQCLAGVRDHPNIESIVNELRLAYENYTWGPVFQKVKVPITTGLAEDFPNHQRMYSRQTKIELAVLNSDQESNLANEFEEVLRRHNILTDMETKGWEYIKDRIKSERDLWNFLL